MTTSGHPREALWSRRLALVTSLAALLMVVLVANQIGGILIASELRDDYERLVADAEDRAADEPAQGTEAVSGPPEARPEVTVELVLDEMTIEADVAEVPAWAQVTFEVTNVGEVPHDAVVGDEGTAMLGAGESGAFTLEAPGSGVIEIICTVSGHEAAGMALALPVAGEPDPSTAGDGGPGEATEATEAAGASADDAADYDGERPPLERRDPTMPPRPDGEVHEIAWEVEERVMQVAEDVWQEVWTFEGQAPGPVLRVEVGDTVDLTIRNPDDAEVAHSIDFHASQVAWNDEMRDLAPGEERRYVFEATHAGVFMYHCGTAPALHHIGNAMHGLIVVEPEGGLAEVDHELFFVQHEYYLGPQGEPGDLAKMARTAAEPDLVVFNGVAEQYAAEPIEVGVEDTIRAFVLNNGPSVDTSFHVVGTIFDRVVKEGVELSADNPGRYGSQAVDLAPAQGAYVEFSLAADGLYPIVDHAFNHASAGALGMFKAGDGGPDTDASH